MNWDTIERAASLIGGRAVTLGPLYDGALAGYTIIGNDAVAVYDYDLALEVNGAVEWLDPSSDDEELAIYRALSSKGMKCRVAMGGHPGQPVAKTAN